jgi:glycosyl transferase family 25
MSLSLRVGLGVYVVNLLTQEKRRTFMDLQLGELPSTFSVEWIDAVNGSRLSEDEVAADFDPQRSRQLAGRPLSRGELGCAMSHRLIYRRMIERAEPLAVVIEDDAVLMDRFPEVVEALAGTIDPERPQIILLGDFFTPSIWKRPLWGRYKWMRAWRGRATVGYVVTLAAARALNQAQTPIRRAADWWPDWERHGVVETWGVTPPCLAPSLFDRSSAIGSDRAQRPISLLTRLLRKADDLRFQLTSWRG